MNAFARITLLVVVLSVLCENVLAKAKINTQSDNPAVNDFTDEFTKRIEDNKQVSSVLNLVNMKSSEGADTSFNVIFGFLKNHNPNAESILKELKKIVKKELGDITADQFAMVLGFNIAEELAKQDKLTKDNASDLADNAVDDIAGSVKQLQASTNEEKILSIVHGYKKFLNRFGLNLYDMAGDIVDEFKEETM